VSKNCQGTSLIQIGMFVIVEIGFDQMDIKQMKLSRTFFQIVSHYIYYMLRKFIRYRKQLFESFTLYDNGMKIQDSFIPYEYLVTVSDSDMVLLAKKDEEDKLIPCDSLVHIKFSKKINPLIVKNNLYYHLKYNDISLEVLKYKSFR